MIPTEGAEGIEDAIHFVQFHTTHGLIQCFEIGLDLFISYGGDLTVSFIEKGKDRFTAFKLGWMVNQFLL